jgi:hypothetical protein
MTSSSFPDSAARVTAIKLPIPESQPDKQRFAGIASALISVALLVVIAHQFRNMTFASIEAMIPRTVGFWLIFAAWYLVSPVCEWVIYRRLWTLPLSGIGALLRKLVSNELLLGYLGEAQFYAWARSRVNMTAAPFGAIKDVTVLSALVGNVFTVAILIPTWPLLRSNEFGPELHTVFISLGVVLASSFAILLFRRKLFSMSRPELRFIVLVHLFRTVAQLGLAALMWHWVLPAVPLHLWLILSTLRMLVSRLPLVPNKEVVFAGIALMVLGQEADIASLLAMIAAITLAAHLVVGASFGLAGVVEQATAARAGKEG